METDRIYLVTYQNYEETGLCKACSVEDAMQWGREALPDNPVKSARIATVADFELFGGF